MLMETTGWVGAEGRDRFRFWILDFRFGGKTKDERQKMKDKR